MVNPAFVCMIGGIIGTVILYFLSTSMDNNRRNQYENIYRRPLYIDSHRPRQSQRKSTLPKKKQRRCRICCEDLIDNVRKLSCNHLFHDDCIKKLFNRLNNRSCPLCGVTDSTVECIICLEPIYSNEMKLKCKHLFHSNCIRNWFQQSRSCPLRCKSPI